MLEWEHRDPKGEPLLRGLAFEQPEVASMAADLSRHGRLEVTELRQGLVLDTTSFVGKLVLGPLELTIQPKISGLPLMTLLRYAFGLRQLALGERTSFSTADRAFQELLAFQLAAEAEELIRRGLHRTYQARNEALAVPRGRIDMQRLAGRANTATLELPCVWHPRTDDCLANQILRQGLLLAAQASDDHTLRAKLRRLAAALGTNVTPIELDWRALRRYHREADRLLAAYEPAVTLIGLLLEAQGAALQQGKDDLRLPGFLFDMNRLFEALLGRFLRENLDGYEVREQYRLRGLFAYEPEHNPQRRQPPTPRPDYVVLEGGKAVAFLDAKYRDLWERELPSDMLYQLAIYALSKAAGDQATILYPTTQQSAREARIQILHPFQHSSIGRVILRPVKLHNLAALLEQPETNTTRRERTAFARQLAFGAHDPAASQPTLAEPVR